MAEARSNIVMSTNTRTLGEGDIEEGISNQYATHIERIMLPIEAPKNIDDVGKNEKNTVKIDKWARSLEFMLEDVPHYMCNPGHPARISRIPENLREVDRKSYEPCYLSIGPYHNGKLSLQRMEKRKWVVLKCFLDQKPELTLKDLLKEIRNIEPDARRFYTNVEMESKAFVQMLLLDSLYLLLVFCGMPVSQQMINQTDKISIHKGGTDYDQINEGIGFMDDSEDTQVMKTSGQSNDNTRGEDIMNAPAWYWTLLAHDLFLLENQLPFFVLEKIHHICYGVTTIPLMVTIKSMFNHLLFDYGKMDSESVILPTEEIHHLLHLCHMYFRPSLQMESSPCLLGESNQMFRLGSAVQLYEAGVTFEEKSCSTRYSLLDITFSSSGKMVLPSLHVDDNTNSLLRNLIALEQMKYPSLGLDVSAYAVLLLHLITKPEDVKLLRKKGIIQHHLASDKEMMFLINRLSVGLAFDYVEDNYRLRPVFYELKRFSNNRVPRWRAWLKHRYFNNPWTAMSLMAASILLLLTGVQTYYAVYSYYYPWFDGHS